jgi:hypothetical protein
MTKKKLRIYPWEIAARKRAEQKQARANLAAYSTIPRQPTPAARQRWERDRAKEWVPKGEVRRIPKKLSRTIIALWTYIYKHIAPLSECMTDSSVYASAPRVRKPPKPKASSTLPKAKA